MGNEGGTITTSLGRLRNPIHIHIYEVCAQSKSTVDFTYPEKMILKIVENISRCAHVHILFVNEAGQPYRIIFFLARRGPARFEPK